jgi:hypothetical protein
MINNNTSRREFAKNLAYSTLGVSILGNELKATESKKFGQAKHAIIITLSGGMSHVDSFDPKEESTNAGIKPINTNVEGITVSQYFPGLAKHADKFSILRGMTSKNGSHEGSTYMLKTSYNKSALLTHPTIGPIKTFLKGRTHQTLPDTVLISCPSDHPKNGYLNASYTPLPIINPVEGLRYSKTLVSGEAMSNRMKILDGLNDVFRKKVNNPQISSYTTLYDETMKTLRSKDLEAFDLTKETTVKRESYGMDTFGQGCLLATRLINSGISVVEVGIGGWDNHVDIQENMKRRTQILDKALTALFDDLSTSGKLHETLVVVESEFGRTPIYRDGTTINALNQNQGRDHHILAFSCLIGGCGLGGKLVGKSDKYGERVEERPITFSELNATIGYMLGIDPIKQWMTPNDSTAPGRPMSLGNGANPIIELLT